MESTGDGSRVLCLILMEAMPKARAGPKNSEAWPQPALATTLSSPGQ